MSIFLLFEKQYGTGYRTLVDEELQNKTFETWE